MSSSTTPLDAGAQFPPSALRFLVVGGLAVSCLIGTTNGLAPLGASIYSFTGFGEPASTAFPVSPRPTTANRATSVTESPRSDQATTRWLHENSGLTWEQLARLFGVSRRTVHLWANGGKLNSGNAEALGAAVRLVQGLNGLDAASRRAEILTPGADGKSLFETFIAARTGPQLQANLPSIKVVDMLDTLHDVPEMSAHE